MKTLTTPSAAQMDYTVKLIGGLKTRLAFSEVRNEKFSGVDHLAIQYIAPSGDMFYAWLPLTFWAGGQILSTEQHQLADVWVQ